jgi:hypothetical protein
MRRIRLAVNRLRSLPFIPGQQRRALVNDLFCRHDTEPIVRSTAHLNGDVIGGRLEATVPEFGCQAP